MQRYLVPSMSLEEARKVLQTLVITHEDLIVDESNLDSVNGLEVYTVRKSLWIVAQDLGANKGAIRKRTQLGWLTLSIKYIFKDKEKTDIPGNIYMDLINDGLYVLESEFPLTDSDSWFLQQSVRFSDFRYGKDVTTVYTLQKNFELRHFRKIWRGARWLSANMLEWSDSRVLLPEEIDNKSSSLRQS